ncbi:uncharacterized protein C8Q71DRAFT_739945 [Rhodofomes roseus]|uniref:Uncharacterized protein n=1 Tax=Rhodofomes roseus TaxID=34475 RepID=A0ABQ8KQ95_9APHY|nr:uncharacterized protein C8Q71DRAFT_739945 [Rhodofomes roseus]KAH9840552.1 hypothetical protein C8Q71DRAFT_739945 [Rhodofomes roseus]
MSQASALGPIDPESLGTKEEDKAAPWIVRKLVGSMTGRIVMSSYETLRSAGTSVVCLSPWGDSSPLLLPCIRFRDLAVHTVIAATGGMAAIAAPAMGPISDIIIGTVGDSLVVELGTHVGFELTTKVANDLVFDKTANALIPIHSARLQTTGVKTMLITLKYKHIVEDAALGFFRSSVHQDLSLFASVMDYLAVEKGWFSPYLFASGRRPIIPRSMKPDVVFCHGPFLSGDYRVGETLLAESASVITFAPPPSSSPTAPPEAEAATESSSTAPASAKHSSLSLPSLSHMMQRSRTPSPEPALTPLPAPPKPRRLVLLVVGLAPHRKLWTTSQRPSESVINYTLLNGCPAIVLPARVGAPLVAWVGRTLEQIWSVRLPPEGADAGALDAPAVPSGDDEAVTKTFAGLVGVLFEYVDLCVDWARVEVPGEAPADGQKEENGTPAQRAAVRNAVAVLVAAAVQSGESKEVKNKIDKERAGIAMWRIP